MASLNKVFLLGNLTRDPETKNVPSGARVTTFDLATSRTFRTKSSETKEEVCFITIIVWGKAAEACAEFLKKGRQVLVEGRLQFRTWEGKDGGKHSKHEVVADRVQFLGPKANGSGTPAETEEDVPF